LGKSLSQVCVKVRLKPDEVMRAMEGLHALYRCINEKNPDADRFFYTVLQQDFIRDNKVYFMAA